VAFSYAPAVGGGSTKPYRNPSVCLFQSCPWVGLTHGLRLVGSTTEKVLKIRQDYVNAFKARLDKIWFHQAVKFDFTADLTGTGNR